MQKTKFILESTDLFESDFSHGVLFSLQPDDGIKRNERLPKRVKGNAGYVSISPSSHDEHSASN